MVAAGLPFQTTKSHGHKGGDAFNCPMFRMLPKKLQKESKAKPHLWEYLHLLPLEELGVPEYYEELNRGMGDMAAPNLIYPVGKGVFIHILPDLTDARNHYIAIEPGMNEDVSHLMEGVEIRLVDYVTDMEDDEDDGEKRSQTLLKSLSKVCSVTKSKAKAGKKAKGGKLQLNAKQMASLRYLIIRDKEGMGPLEPLILDPNIEDISCSGTGNLFVEHKIFKSLKSSIIFESFEALDSFVIRMSEKIGKPVTYRDPIVDATLPDGSRINIVFGGDLSKRGSNFTIRKFATNPLSILQLIQFNTLTYEMAAYFSLALAHGMNMFVSGETASGKTTVDRQR